MPTVGCKCADRFQGRRKRRRIPSPRLSLRLVVGAGQDRQKGRKAMLRLIAVAFAMTVASAAQALPPVVSLNQPDTLVTPVREACGAGMHMVGGKCVRTQARRAASRCVRGKTC